MGVGGADREAVHRRVVEAGHRLRGDDLLGQQPAQRLAQRHLLRIEPRSAIEDRLPRRIDVEQPLLHLACDPTGVDAIVAILAGGRSTRMGRPKALVELAGRPLVEYPIAAARSVDLEPWVIAKPDSELPPLDCRLLAEPAQPLHPLCGVSPPSEAAAPKPVVAVAADMPFVEDKLLAWLASHLGTTVVSAQGRLQPLLARYDPTDLPALEAALEREASARDAVAGLDPRVVPEEDLRRFGDPARLCFNVNTPADLELAEQLASVRPVPG